MRLLSITLLALLLWASCIQANDSDDNADKQTDAEGDASEETTEDTSEEETEETPKKEKTTEIEEEKDVMVLHINNFARALSENKYLLVEFCEYYQNIKCNAMNKQIIITINTFLCTISAFKPFLKKLNLSNSSQKKNLCFLNFFFNMHVLICANFL